MAVLVQTTDQSLQARGPFCVVKMPQDVLQAGRQRVIATWTHPYSPKTDGTGTPQMRGELNTMIWSGSGGARSTTGSSNFQKPFEIVTRTTARQERAQEGSRRRPATAPRELHQMNQCMQEAFQEAEWLQMDSELLRPQIEELKNEDTSCFALSCSSTG